MSDIISNDNDRTSNSHYQKQKTILELVWLQEWHAKCIAFYLPTCIGILIMACLWADITAKPQDYNADNDWEACLVAADYTYLTLNSTLQVVVDGVNAAQSQISDCLTTVLTNQSLCSQTCAYSVYGTCLAGGGGGGLSLNLADIPTDTGDFLNGLSYVGIQCIIFSAIIHAVVHRSLRHPSWLISAIGLSVWFIFAIFTYYTFSPILPFPESINSTFLTYLYYMSSYTKYDNFNNGENDCIRAYGYVWVYLAMILFVAVTCVCALGIVVYAENIRYKSPNKVLYQHLNYTELPCILSALAFSAYILFVCSKMVASLTDLYAINQFTVPKATAGEEGYLIWFPQIYFPFPSPTLDIATVLGICSFTSVLRGYTIQSLSAFRFACLFSIICTLALYPAIVGAWEFYRYNDFQDFDTCWHYFLETTPQNYGYPSEEQAKNYCYAVRLSLGSSLIVFFLLHLLSIACYLAYATNSLEGRESFIHEQIDFESVINESRRNSLARKSSDMPGRTMSLTPGINNRTEDMNNPLYQGRAMSEPSATPMDNFANHEKYNPPLHKIKESNGEESKDGVNRKK